MNKFTTLDTIKEAFRRQFGDGYQLTCSETGREFSLIRLSDNTTSLRFEYDIETHRMSYPKVIDMSLQNTIESMFVLFDKMTISNYISTLFFEHPLARILFKDPVSFDNFVGQTQIMGKRMTLTPAFRYENAWNLMFVEMGYFVKEDFTLQAVVDFSINMPLFGCAHFFVDEINEECFIYDMGVSGSTVFRNNASDLVSYKPSLLQVDKENSCSVIQIIKNDPVGMVSVINEFMVLITPVLYNFYLDRFKFNNDVIKQNINVTIDDFRVLEMLKI